MRQILSMAVALIAAQSALAGLVVGNDQSGTATIWDIDVDTGVATAIFSGTGTNAKPWGMAYAPNTNTLYWNNGGNLFSSAYGPALTPSAAIPMTFNGNTVNFVGLGWRNGKLLGTRNIATEAVYEIDPATGISTLIYTYPSSFDFGGVDVDAATGRLYGLSDSGGAGLYEIDTAGATQTFLAGYPAGETDIDGLAVHNGTAYFVTDGPNTTQANFYVYDIASGLQVGTLPSPFTGSGTFSAAAFVPSPGGAAALLMLGAVSASRRRR